MTSVPTAPTATSLHIPRPQPRCRRKFAIFVLFLVVQKRPTNWRTPMTEEGLNILSPVPPTPTSDACSLPSVNGTLNDAPAGEIVFSDCWLLVTQTQLPLFPFGTFEPPRQEVFWWPASLASARRSPRSGRTRG